MSVTKNKSTNYHDTAQDVKYKLIWLRLDSLNNIQSVSIRGGMSGTVGNTPGEVDYKESSIGLSEIQANCTTTEKNKIKSAVAIFERELARAEDELTGETHDNTDVFVEPSS